MAEFFATLSAMATDQMEGTRGYEAFISAVASRMDSARRRLAGYHVSPANDRTGSSMVVAYWISEHTVLWCDPAIADELAELADPTTSKSQGEISSGPHEWVGRL